MVADIAAQNATEPLKIDHFFEIKNVRNPQISPDGKWVAYTVSESDLAGNKSETRIWMVPADGGEAIPMTAKGYSAGNPRWSPDGKYLSFTASRNSGQTQVWALNRLGGEAQQITDIKQGVSGYEWSPDGSRLLLMIRDAKPEAEDGKKNHPEPYVIDRLQFKRDYVGYLDRRRVHLYVYTPGDSAAVQITSGDYDNSQPAWSPDGKRIAFVSNRTDNPDGNSNNDIWIVDADNTDKGQNLVQVTTAPGNDRAPAWSPDGRHITYVTVTDTSVIWYATNHLAVIPAEGGTPRVLTESLDRNVSNPRFSPDGRSIWFILEDAGESQLASIRPDGRNLNRVIAGQVSVSNFDMQGQRVVTQQGTSGMPDEIFSWTGRQLRQLTSANAGLMSRVQTGEVKEITFSSKDGTEIGGFLVKPVGYEAGVRYPTILWIHGGPVAQYEHSFNFTAQLYAANGYVVLLINPRGSSGYGQAFSEILFADWGNKDFEDVMAAVDYAIDEGYTDPEKLGVGGWSYGGILTNYVITKSDRFKGAISGASEALYRANYGHDHYQLTWEKELGLPWETPEKWERISPFNDVANIVTPTLWIGGALDWNVPILNSEQMYQAMRRLGRETLLVVYPGEHHGIRQPVFQKDRFERYLDWYGRYVKGEAE
ncbi:MAG: S9 family peptidase [Balneolaceae bacterium]|nr:MAG: S9 family peptidase [Balneolaceae bacterium]